VIPDTMLAEAESLLDACRAKGITLATVESCTGGLVAATLTAIAHASDVVERGFVTYTNDAKHELVGVPLPLIAEHGAVSEQVAAAMAAGGVARSRATIAVSVTGVAGPGGGSAAKPVGLVHIACAMDGRSTRHRREVFPGDRAAIRQATVVAALELVLLVLEGDDRSS